MTKLEVAYKVECLPEDVPVRGNAMVSGDAAYDKKVEDKILRDLRSNPWAWCTAKVTAYAIADGVLLESDPEYLGACSYKSEADFKAGGYYDDMARACLMSLSAEISALRRAQS